MGRVKRLRYIDQDLFNCQVSFPRWREGQFARTAPPQYINYMFLRVCFSRKRVLRKYNGVHTGGTRLKKGSENLRFLQNQFLHWKHRYQGFTKKRKLRQKSLMRNSYFNENFEIGGSICEALSLGSLAGGAARDPLFLHMLKIWIPKNDRTHISHGNAQNPFPWTRDTQSSNFGQLIGILRISLTFVWSCVRSVFGKCSSVLSFKGLIGPPHLYLLKEGVRYQLC